MDVKAEHINPYEGDNRGKAEQVRQMFDSISGAYDFMNRAMTMGVDRLWRRKAVRTVERHNPRTVVDLATGTGDLAIALARSISGAKITGYDLSEGMLQIGCAKVEKAGLSGRISLHQADCLSLPASDNCADAVTVAYGVRNFEHLLEGYREMLRILRPGGLLCVLELSTPRGRLTAPLYRFYTRRIIPLAGRLISRDKRAYTYLPESIAAVPQGAQMCALMSEAGFRDCRFRPMTFGACTMYTAVK